MKNKKKFPFLSSNDIRRQFLAYFHAHDHEVVPSSSLIPQNDPSLLFTNAGMVQFKNVFLGKETRAYKRAVSAQRCVRAGGKHNDLERVGYTARHHTFFEMLGNFSFGDYFKQAAIQYSWEFLTKKLNLPPEKLWITVFNEDQEAEEIWLKKIKIDPQRFSRCGEHDNFWAMGPTGPCGPCTEIFYDHGAEIPGGPPGSAEADGDRYVEIWNLVFMQYDRAADGSLNALPKPSVDTGMGLERIAAVMQGVHNNYDTDLFIPLIQRAKELAKDPDLPEALFSLRVIADHIRSCSFLIMDGITPTNEGRGYVLRRIIRRAARHGNKLGINEPFFYKLVPTLVTIMGEAYPGLKQAEHHIQQVLRQEEEQFSTTLSQGLKLFEQIVAELKGNIIPGETIFKLYDTYGFPADLTADIARERNLLLDYDGFETAMDKQRERSRQTSQFAADYSVIPQIETPTEFIGHKPLSVEPEQGKILAMYKEGKFIDVLKAGEKGSIVLDRTPFYAESGGQVGDQGVLTGANKALFKVLDTVKQGHMHLHLGKLERGELHLNEDVEATVDAKRRAAIVLNHTATHLLHLVLKEILGEHAIQKGSLVAPDRLRFDFAHAIPLSEKELQRVEARVNDMIRSNYESSVRVTSAEEAIASGAIALFGEKYGSKVRVVQFGPSKELCGGTHADRTGDIGFFKITNEVGIAAGIRRIEAVTGEGALHFITQQEIENQNRFKQAEERLLQQEKEIQQLKDKIAALFSKELASKAIHIGKIKVLTAKIEELDGKSLRQVIDHLKQQLKSAVIILASVKGKKVGLVGGVTDDLVDKLNAKEIVTMVANQIGGKGGGRAELAEAGGNKPEHLEKALQSVYNWIEEKIGKKK